MTINNISNNTYTLNKQKLSIQEREQIMKLQAIDTKVRSHEQAHISAGAGVVTGGASYTYQKGPDGKNYAVAGEVPISISKGKTPKETIEKMQKVIAAALAPSDPSPQDLKVAATAKAIIAKETQKQNRIDFYA